MEGVRLSTSICRRALRQAWLPCRPLSAQPWDQEAPRGSWQQLCPPRGLRDHLPLLDRAGLGAGSETLVLGWSGQGLGRQHPVRSLFPRRPCPSLSACLSSRPPPPAAGSCGERWVRAGSHQAPRPAAPAPSHPHPAVGRGKRPEEPPGLSGGAAGRR